VTEDERKAVASEILEEAVKFLSETEAFEEIGRANTGEVIPIYIATSDDGFGAFNCQYYALDAVVTLIAECESYYDQSGESQANRDMTVRQMAGIATRVMLVNMRGAIGKALTETFKDGQIVASGVLAKARIKARQKLDGRPRMLDSRELIKDEVRRVGADRRDHLRDLLERIPGSLTKAKSGRKRKVTPADVRRARDELREQHRPVNYTSVSMQLECDESTVRKLLSDQSKTLDSI
jgi:hypothetical protein